MYSFLYRIRAVYDFFSCISIIKLEKELLRFEYVLNYGFFKSIRLFFYLILTFQGVVDEQDDRDSKRCKTSENKGFGNSSGEKEGADEKQSENQDEVNTKAPEPPKDFIHVRARRGQATDSHSLAERVRNYSPI